MRFRDPYLTLLFVRIKVHLFYFQHKKGRTATEGTLHTTFDTVGYLAPQSDNSLRKRTKTTNDPTVLLFIVKIKNWYDKDNGIV